MNATGTQHKRRIFFVINPVSGLYHANDLQKRIEQRAARHGWDAAIYHTTGQEVLKDVVAKAVEDGYELVVAAGGDGTVCGVADGLVHSGIPLGILPLGTWNAFVRNFGLPLNIDLALQVIAGSFRTHTVDAISVKGHIHLLNTSIGVSSRVIKETTRVQKRKLGPLAYIWNMIQGLLGLKNRRFTITVDGVPHAVRATEVMVSNSSLVGIGELPTSLGIDPGDGRVEVCIVRARTLLDFLMTVLNILVGRSRRNTGRYTFLTATRHITIDSAPPLPAQADGEVIGETPLEIDVIPGAIDVIVPLSPPGLFRLPPI